MLYFYRYCYNIIINVINTNKDRFAVLFNRFIYTLQCVIGDSFGQFVAARELGSYQQRTLQKL